MAEPDRTVYQQPSVRQCTTWTPPLVRLIKAQADSGQLQRIADLCDDMLSDDRILGVLSTLADSLLGVNLGFDDGARRGRRKKVTGEERSDVILALEDDGDWWELCSEDQARQVIIWCKLIGYCPGQLVWPTSADYQRGGRVVPRLEFWHPRTLRWDPQLRAWFIRVGDDGTEVPFTPGDGKWVLFTIGGQWRPWSNGVWRGLALLYLLKSYAKDDLGKLGANAARAVATDDEDHDRGERQNLAQEIYRAERNAVIALPKGVDLKLLGVGQGTAEVYQQQIDIADKAISISVLGQNLTTDVTGGSYAAARIHGQVKGQVVSAAAERFSTDAHDQILTWYAEVNFGSRALAPWPVFDTEPPEDVNANADVLLKVAQAIVALKQQYVALDLPELEQKFGIKFAEQQPEPPAPEPPAPPEPGQTEPNAPPEPGTAPAPGGPVKVAEHTRTAPAALASGAIQNVAGFVEGQTYADALVDHGIIGGTDLMAATVADLLTMVDGVDSLDTARAKVLAMYRDAPAPEALAEQCERLFMLSQLAGVAAVNQDAPEARGQTAEEPAP